MKVTIELTDEHDIKIYMQAPRMYGALSDFSDFLRNQDKYTDNDVSEIREAFRQTLLENDVSLG